jgi:hypothetical protein
VTTFTDAVNQATERIEERSKVYREMLEIIEEGKREEAREERRRERDTDERFYRHEDRGMR